MTYTVVIKCAANTLEQDGANTNGKQQLHAHVSAIFCLINETKGQMFHGIPGFYLTRGTVDDMTVILSTHLVARKCKVFTTASSREIQLCTQPATHLTLSPLLTANHVCQSIAHVQRFKWKGSVHKNLWKLMWKIYLCSVMTQHPLLCSSQADLPPFLAYTCLLQIYHLPMIQLRKAWALCPALDPDRLSQAHCC